MAKDNKKEEAKAIVEAVALTPLRYNDFRYEVGDKLELTETEFEVLLEKKLVNKRVDE